MTRFLLSLDQAVDTVFAALKDAMPGETFVPNAPSATVLNLAKALIADRNIDVKITGIRPGEKMHEIMVSDEECQHTVKRGDYYAIQSMLPEIQYASEGKSALSEEFSSASNVITMEQTVDLLEKHNLHIGQASLSEGGELLA
jgi:UDP-glucose 4-epimerase